MVSVGEIVKVNDNYEGNLNGVSGSEVTVKAVGPAGEIFTKEVFKLNDSSYYSYNAIVKPNEFEPVSNVLDIKDKFGTKIVPGVYVVVSPAVRHGALRVGRVVFVRSNQNSYFKSYSIQVEINGLHVFSDGYGNNNRSFKLPIKTRRTFSNAAEFLVVPEEFATSLTKSFH